MTEQAERRGSIDTPPVTNILGRDGVDEDIEAVAHEADEPAEDDDLADAGDEEMDDTNAGAN